MRHVTRTLAVALPLSVLLVASGCCCLRPGVDAQMSAWFQDELYFGTAKKDGGSVTDPEWADFLTTVVTPHFPDGLTVLDAYGQWRNGVGGLVRERSKLVIILHPPDAAADAAIRDIVAQYKARFGQESVLHARQRVAAEF